VVSDDELGAILEALESSGLAHVYVDDDGRETMRLTEEGAALAEELGILEHGVAPDKIDTGIEPPQAESIEPLDLSNSWGTAMGAAMLGFEQALRSEPPPETTAAEQVPERGYSGEGTDVVIDFPDPIERTSR